MIYSITLSSCLVKECANKSELADENYMYCADTKKQQQKMHKKKLKTQLFILCFKILFIFYFLIY